MIMGPKFSDSALILIIVKTKNPKFAFENLDKCAFSNTQR